MGHSVTSELWNPVSDDTLKCHWAEVTISRNCLGHVGQGMVSKKLRDPGTPNVHQR